MTSKQLTLLRSGATAIIAALTGLLTVYPNDKWTPLIVAAISAGSAIGIHVIPSINNGGNKMSSGAELMGIVRPADTAVPAAEQTATESETTPEITPDVAPEPVQPVQASATELLTNVVAGLQEIIKMLS